MSDLDSIMQSVIDMANSTDPFAPVTCGALPVNNSLCMAYQIGSSTERYRRKDELYSMVCTLNGKHTDQQLLIDNMWAIHKHLTRAWGRYPANDSYQVIGIETDSAPTYLARQDDGYWLYGSALRINFYLRGE